MLPDNITKLGLAVATDIHLDHVEDPSRLIEFFAHTASLRKKGLTCLVTGDLTNYHSMLLHLPMLEQAGIKFVLGNHDIWGANFEQARARAKQLAPTGYLPAIPFIKIKDETYLVGVDGYFDMRLGRLDLKRFETWDLTHNASVAYSSVAEISLSEAACRKYCRMDAELLIAKVEALPEDAQTVVIATHVPPFPEVSKYRGKPSEPHALPFYVNATLGETLLDLAARYPAKDFVCLSGHTHEHASAKMAQNLLCIVNSAHYRYPKYAVWA